jgi:hypothetical protein
MHRKEWKKKRGCPNRPNKFPGCLCSRKGLHFNVGIRKATKATCTTGAQTLSSDTFKISDPQ